MSNESDPKPVSRLLSGLVAVALFVVLAVVFVRASFGDPTGFPADAHVTASLGYALFNVAGASVPGEGFLAAFEIIDLVLVGALVGAVMLARRETGGALVGALGSDQRSERSEPATATDGGEN